MKQFGLMILIAVLLLVGLVTFEAVRFNDGKLHVIFCDVGQGDAIIITTPGGKHLLIDGGPDRAVVGCLARHMPFWNRRIDLILLTHPHADHFFGMYDVLERYEVGEFATEDLENKIISYRELLRLLAEKQIPQKRVLAGDTWSIGGVTVSILGPTQSYLDQTSPGGTIGESKEFASLITQVSYGSFDLLLTGDSQASGLKAALGNAAGQIDILQSPHHGSATGLDDAILQSLTPSLAVISVGANNRYGHPSKKTLELFNKYQIKVLRTDQSGDIELVSNGSDWHITN